MPIVWMAFAVTALLLAVGARLSLRYKGEQAAAERSAAGFLFAMAVTTALFPALLPPLGVRAWVSAYVALIILLSGVMTAAVVRKAWQAH